MGFSKLLDAWLNLILSEDFLDRVFSIVYLIVKDVPTRRFGKQSGSGEEEDRVDLHDDDWQSPCPFVVLCQVVSEDDVDNKCHIETQDIGLEFFSKGGPAGIVFGEFRRVDWYHRIDATLEMSDLVEQ